MIANVQDQVSFANFVNKSLRNYRFGIPIVFSIFAGLAVAIAVVFFRAGSDGHLISAFAPHLSTLVETQDRPEILRLLSSIAGERGVELVLVQSGRVLASTRSDAEMDLEFQEPRQLYQFEGGFISSDYLVSMRPVRRSHGPITNATIYIYSPLIPIFQNCLIIAVLVLLLSLLASQIYDLRIAATLRKAIQPIEDLDVAIRDLINLQKQPVFVPLKIKELDHIQSSIIETRRALNDATDRLAQAKAKDLLADSYRRLIHDLYTPVAALREVIKLVHEPAESNQTDIEKINARVIRLAEQVLNQVSSAQETLVIDHHVLKQEDLRKCVGEAAEQSVLAFARRTEVTLIQKIPDYPILVPHDPDNLRRAVTNLISNALRASKKYVEIEVEVKDSAVAIRVSDDGAGVDEDELRLLLNGRLQSQNASRPGYGLPSANHIARIHGGRIVYKTSPLGGACFEIRM